MCGLRQLFFFQCGAEMSEVWTPLHVIGIAQRSVWLEKNKYSERSSKGGQIMYTRLACCENFDFRSETVQHFLEVSPSPWRCVYTYI